MDIQWLCLDFTQLSTHQLYDVVKLRVDVFVVEQNCAYEELDNKDRMQGVKHLLGYVGDELVAYARLLPPGSSVANCSSIGRVLIKSIVRKKGVGDQLIKMAIQYNQHYWLGKKISIEAQTHLERFYQKHGFATQSLPFDLDGISHIEMTLA
ncbi:GNAT family N-acetyltransferase [Vibrio palustris]|uniref:Putative acyltransferase n=1 Tax=Vibrio palustris TaxID=1918946 RepID=A0A1R4B424_9VIBR|nr:GNAT family N-acetyltransferase [Vibrio palustris]SJL83659.1 putative acyltransferase [Vibrio palustris]